MDVHRLRVLRAVVASGSIQGAAANLGYTPSAVSQQVSTLQRECGLRLVARRGRGIEVTAAGRALATESARVFERLADLDALVADLRSGRVGALSVSYFASAGTAWIPAVVAALVAEFPRLRLELRLVELAEPGARAPDVEIAVDGARPRQSEGFHVHALLTEPYLAVVPLASPLAGRTSVDLLELSEHAWVDNDASRGFCRQVLVDACSAVGFSPSFQVETQDYPTAIAVVAGGMGITVVPRLGLGTLPATTTAVPIVNPTPRRSISVRVRETVAEHPAVARVLALLRERTTAHPPVV